MNAIESEFVERSVQRKKNRRRQILCIFTGVTLALSGLTGWALYSLRKSLIDQIRTSVQASEANFNSKQGIETLVEAVKAAKTLNRNYLLKLLPPSKDKYLATQVKKVLYQASMKTHERNRLELEDKKYNIKQVQFSPDGRFIVTKSLGETSNIAKLWNSEGVFINTLLHQDKVDKMQFSPDSQFIITISGGKTVRLWNSEGKLIDSFRHQDQGFSSWSWHSRYSHESGECRTLPERQWCLPRWCTADSLSIPKPVDWYLLSLPVSMFPH